MSDRSFGDYSNRNIVKNPLLSTAVTGLSIEDLTHNAVLLPVSQSQEVITRSDQQLGTQNTSLQNIENVTPNLPSGDANANITPSLNKPFTPHPPLSHAEKNKENTEKSTSTLSKALAKPDDDFDVNEYFARLQGTRYVSAPLNTLNKLKEDKNANLTATEENLEEINLNDPTVSETEVQQSITADIAQNFSQLPTVLPQVASAVFSSFSNMLSLKSREQTPEETKSASSYQEVQFERPIDTLTSVPVDNVREILPPPKEPPVGGITNFRLTTKKKYAQIPGLTSQPQTVYNPQSAPYPTPGQYQNPSDFVNIYTSNQVNIETSNISTGNQDLNANVSQTPPSYTIFDPTANMKDASKDNLANKETPLSIDTAEASIRPLEDSTRSTSASITGQAPENAAKHFATEESYKTAAALNVSPPMAFQGSIPSNQPPVPQIQNIQPSNQSPFLVPDYPSQGQNISISQGLGRNPQENLTAPLTHLSMPPQGPSVPSQGPPLAFKGPPIAPQGPSQGSLIPPPPMFSNQPRKESQGNVGKTILPPSVARRIGSNHPIIKPQAAQITFTDNIFVPAPVQDSVSPEASISSGKLALRAGEEVIKPPSVFTSYAPTAPSNVPEPTSKSASLTSNNNTIAPPPMFNPENFQVTSGSRIQSSLSPNISTTIYQSEDLQSSTSSSILSRPPQSKDTKDSTPKWGSSTASPSNIVSQSITSTPPGTINNTPFSDVTSSIFTPQMHVPTRPQSIFTPSNVPQTSEAPPMFFTPITSISQGGASHQVFNPSAMETSSSHTQQTGTPAIFFTPNTSQSIPQPISHPQNPPSNTSLPEPPKPLAEPPKATGMNFRMIKKRPQYYSGPIEGVGAISNNVKPTLQPLESSSFHGNFFTPQQNEPESQTVASIEPNQAFDITKITQPLDTSKPFELNQQPDYGQSSDLNVAFDLSRPTTDRFEPPKEETKGFGIIGSLKSKLSSLDINKIQSSVTTFFDPAYNEAKKEPERPQENVQYGQETNRYGQYGQTSNFEIFVPSVEQGSQYSQQLEYHGQEYSQDQYNQNYYQNQDHTVQNYFIPPQEMNYTPFSSVPENVVPQSSFASPASASSQSNIKELQEYTPMNYFQAKSEEQVPLHQGTNDSQNDEGTSYSQHQHSTIGFSQDSTQGTSYIQDPNQGTLSIQATQFHVPQSHSDIKIKEEQSGLGQSFQLIEQKDALVTSRPLEIEKREQENKPVKLETVGKTNIPSVQSDLVSPVDFFNMPQGAEKSLRVETETLSNIDVNKSLNTENMNIFSNENHKNFFTTFGNSSKDENVFGDTTFDTMEIKKDQGDIPLELPVEKNPNLTVSAAPLYGLSTMLANKTKELTDLEHDMKNFELQGTPKEIDSIFNRNDNASFFENIGQKESVAGANDDTSHLDDSVVRRNSKGNFFKNTEGHESCERKKDDKQDLNICETCREVNRPEDYERERGIDDLTSHLIENIVSPIQLSNPVEVPLTESNTPVEDRTDFDTEQCEEISHITEDTIETLQIQSATELLDDPSDSTTIGSYGWSTEVQPSNISDQNELSLLSSDIMSTISYVGNNSLFTNASDEIKAEFYCNEEPSIVLPRQISIPTAPPADEDSKSDETGLDVHSIEQDAKKDFPIFEEFVIEPSETDDDKIIYREREKSSEDIQEVDSFTSRVEKFKKMEETQHFDQKSVIGLTSTTSPSLPMASYFDTGNYAVETHYRNSLSSPSNIQSLSSSMQIKVFPPGFEEEYQRRLSGIFEPNPDFIKDLRRVPETHTQTKSINSPTFSVAQNNQNVTTTTTESSKILDIGHNPIQRPVIPMSEQKPQTFDSPGSKLPSFELFGDKQDPVGFDRLHFDMFGVKSDTTSFESSFGQSCVKQDKSERHLLKSEVTKEITSAENMSNPSMFSSEDVTVASQTIATAKHEDQNKSHLHAGPCTVQELSSTKDQHLLFSSPQTQISDESFFSNVKPEEKNVIKLASQVGPSLEGIETKIVKAESVLSPLQVSNQISFFSNVKSENQEGPILEQGDPKIKTQIPSFQPSQSQLPDPINFFSNVAPDKTEKQDYESSNRLASYFSSPTKTEPSKPFFELSQGQDHFRQSVNITNSLGIDNKYGQDNIANIENRSPNNVIDNNLGQNYNPNVKEIPSNMYNISHESYLANLNLMRDLTSVQNFETPAEQKVKSANYFTVEYDNLDNNSLFHREKLPLTNDKNIVIDNIIKPVEINDRELNDIEINDVVKRCKHCCDVKLKYIYNIHNVYPDKVSRPLKVRSCMQSGANPPSGNMDKNADKDAKSKNAVGIMEDHISIEENTQDGNMVGTDLKENRVSLEYSPVRHHWFYRVDCEGKSTWRGFSELDSKALEAAFNDPGLNENTLVPTDGGRYDVNVMGRLRVAVYWSDKPSNVRRCSWFYKGTTDARYVPYTESVADKLEEEYRRGMTTGEWHRQLALPNNELVVMHGPAVMVHFLQGSAADAFSGPAMFAFGKRVYRNLPKISVARDIPELVDHLILLVHGAGEARCAKEKFQSMMRPRVVRRGHDETEIEDIEPSHIDHLLLFCHGVGSACDMRFRSVEEVVDDFRATSLQLIQAHYKTAFENGIVGRVEVLPISWHTTLHSGETGVDKRLERITLSSIPRLRAFTNDTVLDVLFYTSPVYCQTIINTVCNELNRVYNLFKTRNPDFKGGISLGGHSLGSVILYDLLCNQSPEPTSPNKKGAAASLGTITPKSSKASIGKQFVPGAAVIPPPDFYPRLDFAPTALYAMGSPIAIFECIRGVEMLGMDFQLPTCPKFFNIFHPYDPIAYRIEPLINPQLESVKPLLIPHHKGRKRMHLELKETMARVGADIKQRLLESVRNTWTSVWRGPTETAKHQLDKVVEEELEKDPLNSESKEEQEPVVSPEMLGKLNDGCRVDHVLQEAPFEMINEYLFAMSSHVCYWESEDTMLLMLRQIYDGLGVQPDTTVPQQNLTVQRTRLINNDEGAKVIPSTSREAP